MILMPALTTILMLMPTLVIACEGGDKVGKNGLIKRTKYIEKKGFRNTRAIKQRYIDLRLD